jgi:hypothetical protein
MVKDTYHVAHKDKDQNPHILGLEFLKRWPRNELS